MDSEGDSSLYRRDEEGTQSSHRMLGFSDALLSIIATVMILPVTHTEISPEQQFDKSIQKLLATRIAVYLMTFLIVTVAWAAHTRLFQVVGKIDDTLALLNLACMMTITLLPYTFSLMVTFPDVPLGIFLFCMCVIAIGSVQVGTQGNDRGLCLPLPTPAESTNPVLYTQGPVPAAHSASSPPWPSTLFCCSCLFPLLLPLVIPADGDCHLPPSHQQGYHLVQRQVYGPQGVSSSQCRALQY